MGQTPTTTVSNPFAINTAAKDAFARLLATENLTVMHDATAQTASFDTGTRVLTLPVWQEMSGDLYDMLCAHEVGHALFTPADLTVIDQSHAAVDADTGVDVRVIHDYLNVCEDIRIDRQMKDRFPGLKRCYAEAGKYLFDKDFFGVKSLNTEAMQDLPLLDRLNVHFKSGIYGVTAVPMTADEAAFLPRLEAMKTWDDVVALAAEIYEYDGARKAAKQQQNKPNNGPQGQPSGSGNTGTQPTGQGQGNDPADCAGDQSDDQSQDGQGQGEQKQDKDQGNGSQPSKSESKPGNTASTGGNQNGKPTRSVTAEAEERNRKNMVDTSATQVRRWKMPTLNMDSILVDFKTIVPQFVAVAQRNGLNNEKLLKDFRTNSADAIKMLVKQFEMKMAADESRRTRSARCGIIDMDRINDYKFADDIFLATEEIAKGKNHGMIFCMDWSGSMSQNLRETIYQLLNLVMFCKSVNIPYEVYLFSDSYSPEYAEMNLTGKMSSKSFTRPSVCKEYEKDEHGYQTTGDYLRFSHFHLLNTLSSRMSKTEFDVAAGMMLRIAEDSNAYTAKTPAGFNLGGTPLDEAVYAMVPVTEKFKRDNRLQVVNVCFLTDGETGSHPFDIYTAKGDANAIPVLVDGSKTWTIPVRKEKTRWGTNVSMQCSTTAILRMYLKHKTGANVVGFFLIGSARYFDHMLIGTNPKVAEIAKESMKENNFAALPGDGFDSNFIIVPTKTVKEANLTGLTGTQLKNTFAKTEKSKRTSRVLMGRVADIIAKNLS
jgi:hypothetical protein